MDNKEFKFDVVIGNPPYQDETIGDNKGYAPPIYHKFLDEAYKVGKIVEMIHPGRFLFNAGSTPKQWNKKMLNDPHLKVLYFEQNSSVVFQNTDIKGGVTITYRDSNKRFEPIKVFTPFPQLRMAMKKVTLKSNVFLNTIIQEEASISYQIKPLVIILSLLLYSRRDTRKILEQGPLINFQILYSFLNLRQEMKVMLNF